MKGMARILFKGLKDGVALVRSIAVPLNMIKGDAEGDVHAGRVKNFLFEFFAVESSNGKYTNVSFEVHCGDRKTLPYESRFLEEIPNLARDSVQMKLLEVQAEQPKEGKPTHQGRDANDDKLSPAQRKRVEQASEQRAWREFQGKGRPGKREER